jgi:hypothetical protein
VSGQTAKQQLASLMMRVHEGDKHPRHEGESEADYYSRVREKALHIQRRERRLARKSERAARKTNR